MTGHGGDYLNKYGRLEKTVRRRVVLSALIVFMVSACSVRSWAAPIVVEEEQFGELMSELLDLTSDLEESIEKIRNLVDSGNGSCGDWVRAGESIDTQFDRAWDAAVLSDEYRDGGDIIEGQIYGFLGAWARSILSGLRALDQAVSLVLDAPGGLDMASDGTAHKSAMTALITSAETCDNVAVMCGISALNTLLMATGFRMIMGGNGQ